MASCCHGRKLFPGVCKTVIELSRVKETQRVLEKHFFGVTSHDVTMKFTLFGFQWFARLALCITSLLTIQPSSHPATLTCYLLQRHYQYHLHTTISAWSCSSFPIYHLWSLKMSRNSSGPQSAGCLLQPPHHWQVCGHQKVSIENTLCLMIRGMPNGSFTFALSIWSQVPFPSTPAKSTRPKAKSQQAASNLSWARSVSGKILQYNNTVQKCTEQSWYGK